MVMDSGVCKFFQCPESSGKDKESIAGFNHFPFSCHQIRHLDEFRNEAVRLFSSNEYFGNDSYDFSAGCQGGICSDTHEAHTSSSVNHGIAVFCQKLSCHSGKGCVGRIDSVTRTAVDGYVFSFFHIKSFLYR